MPPKKEGRSPAGKAALPQKPWNYSKNIRLDFQAINRAALGTLLVILQRWLPDGRHIGHEWVARNPRRLDHHAGSFKINLQTGRWSDFATGDSGGDVISLAAYLVGVGQGEAARRLAVMLGMGVHLG
jgi:hypothetical protein